MRFTKIVATIGPSSNGLSMLKTLAKNGMNIARMNFSHGDHETHGNTIRLLREINEEFEGSIGILLDTNGPEIRTAKTDSPLHIKKNEEVVFSHKRLPNEKRTVIEVSHKGFTKDVKKAKMILIDNGVMEFAVVRITGDTVIGRALDAGTIGSRRHVNVPGAHISLPSFTEKDWGDISFGIKQGVDFIAPSFVRGAEDIEQLRAFLNKKKSMAKIVAKIETKEALDDIENIIDETDCVMVARGDLGAEIPFELVPAAQDMIVDMCIAKGKPVIVATNMLESMIENPMPTRAELTDVAHAAVTKADAVMLSGETANGKYPAKAVEAMRKILVSTEDRYGFSSPCNRTHDEPETTNERNEQTRAACLLAENLEAAAIIAITKEGRTALAVSRHRPSLPILAFTESDRVKRQLALAWGVKASLLTLSKNPNETVDDALKIALKEGMVRKGATVIVVSDILDTSTKKSSHIMTVQIRTAA